MAAADTICTIVAQTTSAAVYIIIRFMLLSQHFDCGSVGVAHDVELAALHIADTLSVDIVYSHSATVVAGGGRVYAIGHRGVYGVLDIVDGMALQVVTESHEAMVRAALLTKVAVV